MLEGTSGVYLLSNAEGLGVAVFKPLDEENLPEYASNYSLSNGMGYFRERAAFMVSNEILEGYSGVPTTVIATVRHEGWEGGEKRGSVQRFVPASSDMSDMGPSNISADEVQKVGILDVLLFNMDRHEGNLLLSTSDSERLSLVPIDHGLCLPEIIGQYTGPNKDLLKSIYFVWQNWPQARQPFNDSVRRLLYRQLADDFFRSVVGKLKEDMGEKSLTCGALTTLKIGALVLRLCVQAGLNLAEIAELVRTTLPGMLQQSWEKAAKKATKIVKTNVVGEMSQHSAAEEQISQLSQSSFSLIPFSRQRKITNSDMKLAVEEDDQVYVVWEALLLKQLEMQLHAMLMTHSASSASTPDRAGAERKYNTTEGETTEIVDNDLFGNKTNESLQRFGEAVPATGSASIAPSDRVEVLDEDTGSAYEDESRWSERRANLLSSPKYERKKRSSSVEEQSLQVPISGRRSRTSKMHPTPRTTPRRRAAHAPLTPESAIGKSQFSERIARWRSSRRGVRGDVEVLKRLMDMLDVSESDKTCSNNAVEVTTIEPKLLEKDFSLLMPASACKLRVEEII